MAVRTNTDSKNLEPITKITIFQFVEVVLRIDRRFPRTQRQDLVSFQFSVPVAKLSKQNFLTRGARRDGANRSGKRL